MSMHDLLLSLAHFVIVTSVVPHNGYPVSLGLTVMPLANPGETCKVVEATSGH